MRWARRKKVWPPPQDGHNRSCSSAHPKGRNYGALQAGDVRKENLNLSEQPTTIAKPGRAAELVSGTAGDEGAQRMQWVATEKRGDVLLAVGTRGDADLQGSNTDCECASGGYPHRLGTPAGFGPSLAGEGGAAPAAGDTKTALGQNRLPHGRQAWRCDGERRRENGDVWMADGTRNRLLYFPGGRVADGRIVETPGLKSPFGVAVDFRNRVWVSNSQSDTVDPVRR